MPLQLRHYTSHSVISYCDKLSVVSVVFNCFNMSSAIPSAIEKARTDIGYVALKEYQTEVVTAYLSGRDVFVSAPTGAGKSLTFEIARTICVQTKTSVTHIMETCVLCPVKINTRVIGGKRN